MIFNRKDKRRGQIVAFLEAAAMQHVLLKNASEVARQQNDMVHQEALDIRAVQQSDLMLHYSRLIREHDAGLSVELPGEGGW